MCSNVQTAAPASPSQVRWCYNEVNLCVCSLVIFLQLRQSPGAGAGVPNGPVASQGSTSTSTSFGGSGSASGSAGSPSVASGAYLAHGAEPPAPPLWQGVGRTGSVAGNAPVWGSSLFVPPAPSPGASPAGAAPGVSSVSSAPGLGPQTLPHAEAGT
jgi:hypothetical protein